jgi:hypothetical protein
VGATASQLRENTLLTHSPSLPNTKSPPLYGNESGYYPSTPDSRTNPLVFPVLSGQKVEKNFHLRDKDERPCINAYDSNPIQNMRNQISRSPTNPAPRIVSPRAAPSSFSVQKRTNTRIKSEWDDSTTGESKTESKTKGRFNSQDSQEKSPVRDPLSGSGLKEYQLAGETFEYLSTDEILPSTAPQKDIRNAMNGISTHEWPEIFHTLTTVRRLGLHHSALLIASNRYVDSLMPLSALHFCIGLNFVTPLL